eukprot:1162006-Pelagomonas_calceolata.AAC.2
MAAPHGCWGRATHLAGLRVPRRLHSSRSWDVWLPFLGAVLLTVLLKIGLPASKGLGRLAVSYVARRVSEVRGCVTCGEVPQKKIKATQAEKVLPASVMERETLAEKRHEFPSTTKQQQMPAFGVPTSKQLLARCHQLALSAGKRFARPGMISGKELLRGSGCTINDLWDRDLDRRVSVSERLQSRAAWSQSAFKPKALSSLGSVHDSEASRLKKHPLSGGSQDCGYQPKRKHTANPFN